MTEIAENCQFSFVVTILPRIARGYYIYYSVFEPEPKSYLMK